MQKPNQEIKFCVEHFDNTRGVHENREFFMSASQES